MLVRHSSSLQETADAKPPRAWLPSVKFSDLGLVNGDIVKVTQNGQSVLLPASLDKGLPEDVVRVQAGHPATAALGAMFGTLTVERA